MHRFLLALLGTCLIAVAGWTQIAPFASATGQNPSFCTPPTAANTNGPIGLTIPADLYMSLDSWKNKPGDEVRARASANVIASNGKTVIIPRNSKLIGHVTVATMARSNSAAPAAMGIVFDRAILKHGKSLLMNATIIGVESATRSAIHVSDNVLTSMVDAVKLNYYDNLLLLDRCGIESDSKSREVVEHRSTHDSSLNVPQTAITTLAMGQVPSAQEFPAGNDANVVAGLEIHATLLMSLDSRKSKSGDEVRAKASVDAIASDGITVIIPRNSNLIGHVFFAAATRNGDRHSALGVVFDRAILKSGTSVPLSASIQSLTRDIAHLEDSGWCPQVTCSYYESLIGIDEQKSPDDLEVDTDAITSTKGSVKLKRHDRLVLVVDDDPTKSKSPAH